MATFEGEQSTEGWRDMKRHRLLTFLRSLGTPFDVYEAFPAFCVPAVLRSCLLPREPTRRPAIVRCCATVIPGLTGLSSPHAGFPPTPLPIASIYLSVEAVSGDFQRRKEVCKTPLSSLASRDPSARSRGTYRCLSA